METSALTQQAKEVLDLIDGTFSNEDANEILRNLFEYKINFHRIKNFNSQIRFGQSDEHSLQRAEELKIALAQMVDYFAKGQSGAYKISAKVVIEPIEE